jgi:hypothetical protein
VIFVRYRHYFQLLCRPGRAPVHVFSANSQRNWKRRDAISSTAAAQRRPTSNAKPHHERAEQRASGSPAEQCEGAGLVHIAAEPPHDGGDLHDRAQPEEFVRA